MALLFSCSCQRKARLISEDDMTDLYVDLFLADQWLRDNPRLRSRIDTTLFYDPIFKKHGYRFEDYDYSLYYYCGRPDKLADITSKASQILKDEADRWRKIKEEDDNNRKLNIDNKVDYEQILFALDSTSIQRLDSAWIEWVKANSLQYELIPGLRDSLAAIKDSLAAVRDSLAAVRDSSAFADSLALRDSLAQTDSLSLRDSLAQNDSLSLRDSLVQTDSIAAGIDKNMKINQLQ